MEFSPLLDFVTALQLSVLSSPLEKNPLSTINGNSTFVRALTSFFMLKLNLLS
jgi:hypothetical protein